IFGTTFNPQNSSEFVTFGIKHLKYWKLDASTSTLKGDRGIFGSRKVQSILCCAFLPNGNFVTGSHGGELLVWARNQVVAVVEGAHQGPIFGLIYDPRIGLLSGGKDGKIILRDNKLSTLDQIDVQSGVRSLCLWVDEGTNSVKVLTGLEDSTIIEVEGLGPLGSGNKTQRYVMEAHSANKDEELWGCAICPNREWEFVSCGDDGMVFKWDTRTRKLTCKATLAGMCRAATYSPDGTIVAIGNDHGDVFILLAEDLSQVYTHKYVQRKGITTKKHNVEVVRFSPNGKFLIVAGHDLVVDVYDVPQGMKYLGSCKGHSSYITQVDFSLDSQFIQTNSADYELLFWSIPSCKQITSATAMRDVKWETQSCVLGWAVQGIWEKGMDGTDINAVDRSPDQTLLASGDDFMNVRLHAYPANTAGVSST
ncbi:Echinoderm microtubule-associated protein-like 1, partial [Nowakowskiella sp. JEL0407]